MKPSVKNGHSDMQDFDIEIVKWMVMGALGFVAWWLQNSITKLQTQVEEIRRDYLHKDDFKEFKTELRLMFDEIKRDLRDIKAKDTL